MNIRRKAQRERREKKLEEQGKNVMKGIFVALVVLAICVMIAYMQINS